MPCVFLYALPAIHCAQVLIRVATQCNHVDSSVRRHAVLAFYNCHRMIGSISLCLTITCFFHISGQVSRTHIAPHLFLGFVVCQPCRIAQHTPVLQYPLFYCPSTTPPPHRHSRGDSDDILCCISVIFQCPSFSRKRSTRGVALTK